MVLSAIKCRKPEHNKLSTKGRQIKAARCRVVMPGGKIGATAGSLT
jgi:hypothetical protein